MNKKVSKVRAKFGTNFKSNELCTFITKSCAFIVCLCVHHAIWEQLRRARERQQDQNPTASSLDAAPGSTPKCHQPEDVSCINSLSKCILVTDNQICQL